MREPIVPEPDSRPRQQLDAPSGGSGYLALFLALAAVGLAGFGAWHGYGRSAELERRLERAEAQLAITSDTQTSSLSDLQQRLDERDKAIDLNTSEMRKLWGVAGDTNRRRISANASSLDALKKQLEDGEQRLQKDIATLRALADSIGGKNLAQASQINELLEQWQALSGRYQQALEQLSSIDGRVGDIEKDIDAINAFRRDTNRRLLELQNQGGGTP